MLVVSGLPVVMLMVTLGPASSLTAMISCPPSPCELLAVARWIGGGRSGRCVLAVARWIGGGRSGRCARHRGSVGSFFTVTYILPLPKSTVTLYALYMHKYLRLSDFVHACRTQAGIKPQPHDMLTRDDRWRRIRLRWARHCRRSPYCPTRRWCTSTTALQTPQPHVASQILSCATRETHR